MRLAITILAIIAIIAALISEQRTKGDDFSGWGVIALAVGMILIENGGP